MAKSAELCNPLCLVNFLHWEVTGKVLACRRCPLADRCKEYQAAKRFQDDIVINTLKGGNIGGKI